MHRSILALVALALIAATPAALQDPALFGFTPESSAAQRTLEARYDAMLSPDSLREWMRELTDKPFYVASEGAEENAAFLREKFEAWGFDTRIETYQVLFPMPVERVLELTAPVRFTAGLEEPVLERDGTSGVPGRLPTYNAYSADGDVEAELVYVNQGIPADYEELERRGISVEGKIVIARYGGSWRGIKPKVAAEHGEFDEFPQSRFRLGDRHAVKIDLGLDGEAAAGEFLHGAAAHARPFEPETVAVGMFDRLDIVGEALVEDPGLVGTGEPGPRLRATA